MYHISYFKTFIYDYMFTLVIIKTKQNYTYVTICTTLVTLTHLFVTICSQQSL